VALRAVLDPARQAALRGLLTELAPARAHPEWGIGMPPGGSARLDRAVNDVIAALRQLVAAP
jgi:hypothetical protein